MAEDNTNYTHIGIVMTNISFRFSNLPDGLGVAGVGGFYNWLLCFISISWGTAGAGAGAGSHFWIKTLIGSSAPPV